MLTSIKYIALYFIYIFGIAIFFASLTGRVKYGLLFLIPLIPLQNVMNKLYQFPFGKDFNDILIIGMLIGWVLYKNSIGKPVAERTSYNKITFLYLIFTYIILWRGSSYLGFPAPISALDPRVQNWKNYMILPLLFLITFNNIKNKREIKLLLIVMCLSMFLMNYYTMRQVTDLTAWWNRTKIEGTFVWLGANEVAAFYATYTFVLIGLFLVFKHKLWKIGLGILIFQNMFCNLFLFSRAAYLATIAGASFIGLFRNRKLLIVIAILLIFWNVLLPKDVIARIEFTQTEEGQLDPSAATRLELWEQSIIYFKQSPLIGVGFNVFSHLGMKRDTHNVFLRTLAEQGLIGLGFLLLIMLLALKRGWQLFRRTQDNFLKGLGLGFCACAIAMMVGNFFGDRWTPLPLAAYFWVFLGLVERGNLLAVSDKQLAISEKASEKNRNLNHTEGINLAKALKGSVRPKGSV